MKPFVAEGRRKQNPEARQFEGAFFTPLPFARKALDCLEKVIGPKWWTKNYRLWDMAAGTGNLEWFLPADAYKSIYASSHLHRLRPPTAFSA